MKKNFRTMMLAMATLGLFSCSDKLADDAAQSQTGSADGFVAFQINNVGVGTRAADGRDGAESNPEHGNNNNYDEGEEYEYKITTDQGANVAFFFKTSDGSYVDMSHLQLMSDEAEDGDHAKEKMYSARLRRDESTNSYYCVLILNANPVALEKLANKTLAEFMKEKDEKLGQYGSYFTMSNTVYIDDETDNTLHGPEKISKENICKTWEEAQEHKVKVHVERVVAKFGVNINITDNDYTEVIKSYEDAEEKKLKSILIKHNEKVTGNGTEDDPYIHRGLLTPNSTTGEDGYTSWGIRIKNWGVNAKETETYFTKNLFDGDNKASDYPSAKLSKPAFGNWGLKYNANDFGWNDVTRVRSYWAVDPHYNSASDVYPRQYRKAEDNTDLPYYTDDKTPVLSYISYDNINGSLAEALYAPENTFGDYSGLGTESQFESNGEDSEKFQFLGDRYRWTGTHILVAAELLLGDEVENQTEEVADKYCFEGVYWTESQTGENQAILKNRMVATLLYLYGNLFADDQGTTQLGEDNGSTYFDLVDATIDGGDGRQMLSPKPNQILYKRVVTVGNNNEEKITYEAVNPKEGETEEAFITAIQQCTVQHFNKGKMYYAIPIEHMVALEKDKDTGKTTKFNIGSYGVVRNHWYQINIKTIDKPGTPVDKPGDEIVPNDDPKEVAYIAFEIVVIPWHVINQNVDF